MSDLSIPVAQYLIFVHAMACFLVLFQHAFIGFRVSSSTDPHIKWAVWMCRVVPALQFPISAVRLYYMSMRVDPLPRPADYYIDFIWSPMLTIVLVWLLQLYLAKYCCKALKLTGVHHISSPIKPLYIFPTILIGVLSAAVFWPITEIFACNMFNMLVLTFIMATMFAVLEMAIFRYLYDGMIMITSYSWIWYVGTWIFFAYKAI